ncbi:hypothetical protein AAVH_07119 [Aphelenchoides avenae]|nr:hypothetical protein AAVH_07119 [Aphelenchus avenae]
MWQLWDSSWCPSCTPEFTLPVALTNRQYWSPDSWAYRPQYAVTKVADSLQPDEFRTFCPNNVSNAYLRGMFVNVHVTSGGVYWLPAEFLIPCDLAHKSSLVHSTVYPEWKIGNRRSSLVHVLRRFQANNLEGSLARCKDQFGNAHVTAQDVWPACEYGTMVTAVGLIQAWHFVWTNNNYLDLMEMFGASLLMSVPERFGNETAAWRPMVDVTERKDQCTLHYGYRRVFRRFQMYYGVQCACSANLDVCSPVQVHPSEGICPHSATIYVRNDETKFEMMSVHDVKALDVDNPFDDMCYAYLLFRTYADDGFEIQIELGERCPPSRLDAAENGCHQFVQDCYGIQPKHVAIACCSATFCDPFEDVSSCEKTFAAGGVISQINSYLWNPENEIELTTKLANQINYCAYHSNVWSEGYREERPEYCYVFVDLKWREFVNISSGWNFDYSGGEDLNFPKGKNCTIVHGTVREYCPSVSECIKEVPALKRNVCPPMENDKQHTVVACRCSTHENRTYYCDENLTATDVLNWVEKPQCFNGTLPYRARGRYNSSELDLLQSEDLNVRCYWYDYPDDNGKKWREYGFYNPDDARFAGYHSLDCFPADCTQHRTLPHFCCCRTAKNGAESVCNAPESQLEEEVHVRKDRREPDGMRTNPVERNLCEDRPWDQHVGVTDPRKLVVGLPVRDMCYYKLELRHRKNSKDHEEVSAGEVTRRFYDASLHKKFPLTELLCDRRYWSLSDWLDGCACYAVRNGAAWEQNCCCISTTNPDSMDNAVRSEHEHRLRTFRDFL